jgi:hypothetical protein
MAYRTHHFRVLFTCFLLLAGTMVLGQGKFTVNGRLKIEGSDLSGARAVIYKNGEKDRTVTTNLNKFTLELDLNENYVISFEKPGFVAKKLSFNTRVPADAVTKGFTPFEFAVSLFKQYDDINIVVFNQPVGVIRYESGLGDFDYDTDYTKSIQSQLQQVLAEVEKRQKEEAQQAKAQAAADAKAQAEAKKQADAQAAADAKAQAEAKKQADAAAKAEREVQEVARKAEEARLAEAERAEAEKPRPVAAKPKEEARPVPPPVKATPAPVPVATKPPPVVPQRNHAMAKAHEDSDTRRTTVPIEAGEASPVALARPVAAEEVQPVAVNEEAVTVRNEELVVEPNKVMTIIRLETNGVTTEYRKVIHKWGTTYYFRNGQPCTQLVYEQEVLTEDRLAGAMPRAKLP